MPADITARYYSWYMTDIPSARVIAYQWWPIGDFTSSMSLGRLVFMHRETPGDMWEAPVEVSPEIMWVVAQNLARSEGFTVEVAEHE